MNQEKLDRIDREAKRIKWWVIGCTVAVVFAVNVAGFVVVGAVMQHRVAAAFAKPAP